MKKAIFFLALVALTMTTTAQQQPIKQLPESGTVLNADTVSDAPVSYEETTSYWLITDKETGEKLYYRVYKGAKGGLFIFRVSKQSGKQYKQYLKQAGGQSGN
jgi:hypothetical protein